DLTVIDPTVTPEILFDIELDVSLGDSQGAAGVSYEILALETVWYQLSPAPAEVGDLGPSQVNWDYWSEEIVFHGGWGMSVWGPSGWTTGDCLEAGGTTNVQWSGDLDPNAPGLESQARLGIGQGQAPYGDGHWNLVTGQIDTCLPAGDYTLQLVPHMATVITNDMDPYNPNAPNCYCHERLDLANFIGDEIAFTIIPYTIKGDCDDDCDVDLQDFLVFQTCYTGPGGPLPPDCECADFNGDDDVDLQDFLAFQSAYTGPK
ncbi:unnamed protein product, partial [marine sediment metagenome]